MLTNAAAKAATAQPRAYKLSDAGGLHLFVAPTGTKSWRLKYRFAGREKLLTIGQFPLVSLAEARGRRESAKQQLREGLDPASPGAASIDSFEQLARAWHGHMADSWSQAHAGDVLASLERDIFPVLGARAAGSIQPNCLLAALRAIEDRGQVETARRCRQRLSAIFGYGIAEGLLEKDPAEHLGRAMRGARPPRPQPALTDIGACRDLLRSCEHANARPVTRLASRFLALTAVRLDAVRGMRWEELSGLDGDEPVWIVPAARMKLKRAKKDDDRFDHIVPLSRQAIDVLVWAALENGHDTPFPLAADSRGLVFPGRGKDRPIGEGAIRALYERAGFAGRHVPHGWRASFSTILFEALGEEWRFSIDRTLGHAVKDKVEGAYNRAQILARRRTLFDRWGAMLLP